MLVRGPPRHRARSAPSFAPSRAGFAPARPTARAAVVALIHWEPSPDAVVSCEYRIPLAQNARGVQQVIDDGQFLRVSVRS